MLRELPTAAKRRPADLEAARGRGTPPPPRRVAIPAGCATLGLDRDSGDVRLGQRVSPARERGPRLRDRRLSRHERGLSGVRGRGRLPRGVVLGRERLRLDPRRRHDASACVGQARGRAGGVAAQFEDVPLPPAWPVWVSRAEAAAYARFRGRRLPTEAEWHRAAFGRPDGRENALPWGREARTSRHGNFGVARFDPVPVDSYPSGASAFGVHDLVGERMGVDVVGVPAVPGLPPRWCLSAVLGGLLRRRPRRPEGGVSRDGAASREAQLPQLVPDAVSVRLREVPHGRRVTFAVRRAPRARQEAAPAAAALVLRRAGLAPLRRHLPPSVVPHHGDREAPSPRAPARDVRGLGRDRRSSRDGARQRGEARPLPRGARREALRRTSASSTSRRRRSPRRGALAEADSGVAVGFEATYVEGLARRWPGGRPRAGPRALPRVERREFRPDRDGALPARRSVRPRPRGPPPPGRRPREAGDGPSSRLRRPGRRHGRLQPEPPPPHEPGAGRGLRPRVLGAPGRVERRREPRGDAPRERVRTGRDDSGRGRRRAIPEGRDDLHGGLLQVRSRGSRRERGGGRLRPGEVAGSRTPPGTRSSSSRPSRLVVPADAASLIR